VAISYNGVKLDQVWSLFSYILYVYGEIEYTVALRTSLCPLMAGGATG